MQSVGSPPPTSGRRRAVLVAKLIVAAALIALVVRAVPLGDTLIVSEDGEETAHAGRIVGDWRAERIAFELADRSAADHPPIAEFLSPATGLLHVGRTDGDPEQAPDGRIVIRWRPGMVRVLRGLEPAGLLGALACFALGYVIVALRWRHLLVAIGCETSWREVLRFTALGLFFGIAMPGMWGGDVAKAVLVARRHPARKADALVSVAVDRIIGLISLVAVAATVVFAMGETFAELRLPVLALVIATGLVVGIAGSRRLRAALRIDALLARHPLGGRAARMIDVFQTFADRRKSTLAALLLSFVNCAVVVLGVRILGRSMGDEVLSDAGYFAVVPLANLISTIPVAPGGWGIGEAAFGSLFGLLGASPAIGVSTSVAFRTCLVVLGLAGGTILLGKAGRGLAGELRSPPKTLVVSRTDADDSGPP
ncbi:MAG: flippase-like domain-containing protein [Planctomycetota bacterium]|nr:MAG: flippase-like domain-containing protein [Planctomycetota bacterium]